MRTLAYEVWDVFTAKPLTGNQLGVFLNGRGFSDQEMFSLARELNFSESVFLFGQTPKGHRVRIFTATEELPFAGHPSLGAAAAIRQRIHEQRIVLDLNAGPIPVQFDETGYGEMQQAEPAFAETYQKDEIARWIGVSPDDITDHPIESVSTGRPNIIVGLKTLKVIRAVKMDWAAIGSRAFYLLSLETENPKARAHARKLTPRLEDPATGSAAGCAAAWMVKHGIAKSQERVLIEQGSEVKRPGELFVTARNDGGKITGVRVGGHAVRVMAGELTLP